jgi:hypothetical protein
MLAPNIGSPARQINANRDGRPSCVVTIRPLDSRLLLRCDEWDDLLCVLIGQLQPGDVLTWTRAERVVRIEVTHKKRYQARAGYRLRLTLPTDVRLLPLE